ncbi:MAG: ribosome maturation factor RimM [Solirubrobacterales bacterium]
MPGDAGQQDPIRIGRVGKPHGVRGGFYIHGAIDPQATQPGLAVVIAGIAYEISARSGADARPIIGLAGVDDRDAVSALRNQVITAERKDLTPLRPGEWFASDLEGMAVLARDGRPLGAVIRLSNTPSVDVLETRADDGSEFLIPMVGDAIFEINSAERRIIVDAEFLGLSEPDTAKAQE